MIRGPLSFLDDPEECPLQIGGRGEAVQHDAVLGRELATSSGGRVDDQSPSVRRWWVPARIEQRAEAIRLR